ncbi:MAG: hypothetical protein A2787_01790 [Omnitrophica WOR_2 bacterium RIFCSPHIGHO2_01_FULL_48_9]|nr:MAG: hypothetical protein A3D10_00500 [Omnitrophica WOR_2 bacterium RIFCSPHIGHO2_02_FULL_48_11]OGX31217.1 MAG: hypothetical protein A2787_01790 [Omnitrophica WOR_2 bacterium RIFCSPHIGHO2_01_FULL_48_9]
MIRKNFFIYSIISFGILTVCAFIALPFIQGEPPGPGGSQPQNLSQWHYYQELSMECRKTAAVSCCMASVRRMTAKQAQLVPAEGCSEGWGKNSLKCVSSYQWCEPKE